MNGDEKNQKKAPRRAWEFLAVFLIVFFLIAVFLYAIDFVPEPPSAASASGVVKNEMKKDVPAPVTEIYTVEAPVKIAIAKIGVNTPIENPATTDITTLDQELLKGAVRYPTSAKLGESGTVYLFGHQSYLPVVHNPAFKAFNNLQRLKEGDTIVVSSATTAYVYRVTRVTLATAKETVIPLARDGHQLILSTCNSLGADHEERYVVEAELVSRGPLDS